MKQVSDKYHQGTYPRQARTKRSPSQARTKQTPRQARAELSTPQKGGAEKSAIFKDSIVKGVSRGLDKKNHSNRGCADWLAFVKSGDGV